MKVVYKLDRQVGDMDSKCEEKICPHPYAFKADVIFVHFAHAQITVLSSTHGHTLFWGITQFILMVQAYKLLSE